MSQASAVNFEIPMRLHVALCVKDVAASIPFYQLLFGSEPTKVKADYAKFEVSSPPVNLTLNQVAQPVALHPAQHFGVQVMSTDAVQEALARFEAEGRLTRVEEQTTCCYAVQDKVWVEDPDGHPWEIFVVTQTDTELHSDSASSAAAGVSPGDTAGAACCSTQALANSTASAAAGAAGLLAATPSAGPQTGCCG